MVSDFDGLSREQLNRRTSRKWSLDPGTIGAWVAEMDFGTAPAVQEALLAGVRDQVFGYLTPSLAAEVAAATSDWYADEYAWRPEVERIHSITDVLSGLEIAVRNFSRPGSAVIVPTPAYMPFLTLPGLLGRRIIEVPGRLVAGRWELDLDRIDDAFAAGGGTLLLCNPHNPTGRVLDRAELEAVAAVVERHDGLVLADEVHAPLRFGRPHLPYAALSHATAAHTVTITSTSKAWNVPGLKAAQLILSSPEHERSYRAHDIDHLHEPSTLGVLAATAAYRHGREWLQDVNAYLDRNRLLLAELLDAALPQVEYIAPEATYIGWLDCAALDVPGDPADFFRAEAGVTLTAGGRCGTGYDRFVRLVFATPAPILREIVGSLAAAAARRPTAVA
ncbi:MalY/PatB family protein [uncultured Amnibacterium sp.]|uniref:MalY/PatB family protein n=1 Tax=uncultured Amnibacterium sp. TaxID=1631851 RepID=UPI0035C989CB